MTTHIEDMPNATKILLFKKSVESMKLEKFQKIAATLEIKGKALENENALAIRDEKRVLVYAQPHTKFAGLLFFNDQSKGLGDTADILLDEKRAKRWGDEFLSSFNLIPNKAKDDRINIAIKLFTAQTEAVVFDGKEKKKIKNRTEIRSEIALNGIPVVGPRAKVRIIFKDQEKPILVHSCLWDKIEVYEEKEAVRIHDVVKAVKEKLKERRGCMTHNDIVSTRLAYFATEYTAGTDILAPYYFVEVEFEDIKAQENGIKQGPRQVFWLPAYR
jgi:hypothetical protein